MKKYANGKLNQLTAEVAAELERVCRSRNDGGEGYTLLQGVAWLKRQHKVKTSINQLSRWLARRRTDSALYDMLAGIRSNDRRASAIAAQVLNTQGTQEAISRLIHNLAFQQLATGQEPDPEMMEKSVRLYLESRKVQLKEREVNVDERKMARLERIEAQAAEAKKQLQDLRAKGGGMTPESLRKLESAIKLL